MTNSGAEDISEIFEEYTESYKNFDALRNATDQILDNILTTDPILSDIPYDISNDEVLGLIAVVKGQAITISVERENLPTLKVIVPQSNTTVLDLKKAIKRAFEIEQNRLKRRHNKNINSNTTDDYKQQRDHHKSTTAKPLTTASSFASSLSSNKITNTIVSSSQSPTPITTNISWRYIWRTYLLAIAGIDNNNQPLIDDNQLLSSYGIVNKTVLKFVKRCKYQQRRHKPPPSLQTKRRTLKD